LFVHLFVCFLFSKGNSSIQNEICHFGLFLYVDNECHFFNLSSLQVTSTQLDTFLTELENPVEIPDTILRAVSIVGNNISAANEEI